MAVRVAMCLFAKGLSCVRSRADLAGALVQRSADGVCDIWDLEAQQNRDDPYEPKHHKPEMHARRKRQRGKIWLKRAPSKVTIRY